MFAIFFSFAFLLLISVAIVLILMKAVKPFDASRLWVLWLFPSSLRSSEWLSSLASCFLSEGNKHMIWFRCAESSYRSLQWALSIAKMQFLLDLVANRFTFNLPFAYDRSLSPRSRDSTSFEMSKPLGTSKSTNLVVSLLINLLSLCQRLWGPAGFSLL